MLLGNSARRASHMRLAHDRKSPCRTSTREDMRGLPTCQAVHLANLRGPRQHHVRLAPKSLPPERHGTRAMKRHVTCFCGARQEVHAGFVSDEAKQSGFLPVMDYASAVRWYCPGHAQPLVAAARDLLKHCGPSSAGMLPPWLIRAATS